MLMATNLIGFGAKRNAAGSSLLKAIQDSSLTSGLTLCLDAGDSSSYSSGQTWTDVGSTFNFFLGATSSPSSDDPTFNGSPGGLSTSEFFSFDGGDLFTYSSSNAFWMNSLHKNSASFTLIAAVYLASQSSDDAIFGTKTIGVNSSIGVAWYISSAMKPSFQVANGSSVAYSKTVDNAISSGAWHIIGFSINEATPLSFFYRDGAYDQVSSSDTNSTAYTSPSSSNASSVLKIGTSGTANPMESGSRIAFLGAWNAVALTKANFDTMYSLLKGRFGLT